MTTPVTTRPVNAELLRTLAVKAQGVMDEAQSEKSAGGKSVSWAERRQIDSAMFDLNAALDAEAKASGRTKSDLSTSDAKVFQASFTYRSQITGELKSDTTKAPGEKQTWLEWLTRPIFRAYGVKV